MTPLDIDLEERMKIFKKIEDVGLKTMTPIKIFLEKTVHTDGKIYYRSLFLQQYVTSL